MSWLGTTLQPLAQDNLGAYSNTGSSVNGNIGTLQSNQPMFAGMSNNLQGVAGQVSGQINPTLQYGQQVMNTAFDPQQQLYNYLQAQNTNQTNAGEASRGLAMSPVGAQMSNQANQNFNMGWQNQQLGRQAQGLSAYDQNAGTAGNLGLASGNLNSQAGQLYNAGNQAQLAGINAYMGWGQQASSANTANNGNWLSAIGNNSGNIGTGIANVGAYLAA